MCVKIFFAKDIHTYIAIGDFEEVELQQNVWKFNEKVNSWKNDYFQLNEIMFLRLFKMKNNNCKTSLRSIFLNYSTFYLFIYFFLNLRMTYCLYFKNDFENILRFS